MIDGVGSDDDEFSLEPEVDRAADEAALRAALHFHVGEICSAETSGKPMTGSAVSCLAEVVFKYTEVLALDLRVFAKHGRRAVVGVDDVKCVARKDPKMVEQLAEFETASLSTGKKKSTRKKKQAAGEETAKNGELGKLDDGGATGLQSSSSERRKKLAASATTSTAMTTHGRQPPASSGLYEDDSVELLDCTEEAVENSAGAGAETKVEEDDEFDDLLL